MPSLFWLQLRALIWKNWLVLLKHPFLTLVRAFILPVAYGAFLATAQVFLNRLNNYGIGQPVPIKSLSSQFDAKTALIWADGTNGSLGASSPTAAQIIEHITASFTPSQRAAVRQISDPADIPAQCPQNFNLFSSCFAAVAFYDIPGPSAANATSGGSSAGRSVNYTISADSGLQFIDSVNHKSDFEKRVLPLQWAIDQAIIELQTGIPQQTPLEWPFNQETNEEQKKRIRLSYLRGIRSLLVIALFVSFVGISYQLPGSIAGERALLLTDHMKAMGLLDSARIVSWHLGISLTYLPAWLIVGITWRARIFTESSGALIVLLHVLLGLVLASFSFAVAAPFGRSPQLAAVVNTFLCIILAILALVWNTSGAGINFIISIIFPPAFYVIAIKGICGWENIELATNILKGDPQRGIAVLPVLVAGVIDVFLWPYIAVLWERHLYDARPPSSSGSVAPKRPFWAFWRKNASNDSAALTMPEDTAISVRGLTKVFKTSGRFTFGKKTQEVTAVKDLSLDIPKTGIFVLLGSNGAGKSTSLSLIGGLSSVSSGSILFSPNSPGSTPLIRPTRGTLGLVPQKNVLFPELTCLQTLRVFRAVKWSAENAQENAQEDLQQLLKDCDLERKINEPAGTMSGGQKRKLQLAIGLVGGSKIVLVDECTSGVDPLSRRALWKTLTSFREERAIVFTTHFLDEADLLADHIAILAAPGKVVASGSPVALKRDLGEGYSTQVEFVRTSSTESSQQALYDTIRGIVPATYTSSPAPQTVTYHLKTRDSQVMRKVLEVLDAEVKEGSVSSYDILGTTIEDIFLDLMRKEDALNGNADASEKNSLMVNSTPLVEKTSNEALPPHVLHKLDGKSAMNLANGRPVSPFRQALTIFHKRMLIGRRSWLTPVLTIALALAGACIPLVLIRGKKQSCVRRFDASTLSLPLYLPVSPIVPIFPLTGNTSSARVLESPPGIISTLGNSTQGFLLNPITDNATFVSTVQQGYLGLQLGGVSFDLNTGASLVAWEATPPGITGPSMLNLATNVLYITSPSVCMYATRLPSHNRIAPAFFPLRRDRLGLISTLYNRALNASGNTQSTPTIIRASYAAFPPIAAGTLVSLRWIVFFGAVMAVYPAFFALYVSKERRSSVQAMQMSNGLTDPIGLWLGHLMFDTIAVVILSTIIIIVFAVASHSFNGLGFLWFVMVIYGITAALFAYLVSLGVTSPLAAFATVAGYQFLVFILYLSSYLLVLTYGPVTESAHLINVIHFASSWIAPVGSVTRAALVSVNLFSLLCDGATVKVDASALGNIKRFGGPILYLFVSAIVLLILLVWIDSGSRTPRKLRGSKGISSGTGTASSSKEDVIAAAESVANSDDLLRVVNISKKYGNNQVVDDVSVGVAKDTIFALLGPNGAGKTTTFNIIRGDVLPDIGDVFINGVSVVRNPKTARASLGVCPQFTAIDSQLTVREHLIIYGRLKGLKPGHELEESIEAVIHGTSLGQYSDRLANKLSGGNQRKLALAISLIGNPSVILIDEFSTGIDPKMKREMWGTLRSVAIGKAVVVTTHSMEEASALASSVGILAKRMLAVGTTQSLSARYALYEVHFSCRTRDEIVKARSLMSLIPNSRPADDVATRFEVPVASNDDGFSLAQLFNTLSEHGDFAEYTVEKASLESVFLKVIRQNNIREEDSERSKTKSRGSWRCF